jgi:hypothetical protein
MRKSFKNWTRQELKKVFNLTQADNLTILDDWIDTSGIVLLENEIMILDNILKKSLRYLDSWNETELREKFIIKIVELIDFEFEELECHTFAERYLSATINGCTLYGFVDWFVASGTQLPEKPFFFIHEYKAEGAKDLDGRGQLLSTMLATSALNQSKAAMYGTFVLGRFWFFVALTDTQFAETSAFDVLKKEDLYQVVKILRKQKMIILERLQTEKNIELKQADQTIVFKKRESS